MPKRTPELLKSIQDVDDKLAAFKALRNVALSEGFLVEAEEYRVKLDRLLDARLAMRRTAA
jgi:hypothetical protein